MKIISRYDWLKTEINRIPRKKFHIIEPRSLEDLSEIESQYGGIPPDYCDFVTEFGQSWLFRNNYNRGHHLIIWAPLKVIVPSDSSIVVGHDVVRLKVGHCSETGDAWYEWKNGSFISNCSIHYGFSGQRTKKIDSFEDWLKRNVTFCKKSYNKDEWIEILTPVPQFNEQELRIIDAAQQYSFRKVGVTETKDVRVEIQNGSTMELKFITLGVRSKSGMTGAVAIPTFGIPPGMSKILNTDLYKSCMDPYSVELFRLPKPEPEDRPYYYEFKDKL